MRWGSRRFSIIHNSFSIVRPTTFARISQDNLALTVPDLNTTSHELRDGIARKIVAENVTQAPARANEVTLGAMVGLRAILAMLVAASVRVYDRHVNARAKVGRGSL